MASADLTFALRLADLADEQSMAFFKRADLVVDEKADRSPVSEADRVVERVLREELIETRPGEAILGEEFGSEGSGDLLWIIDPIDGTRNYVRGIPVFATLIALTHGGEPLVGVVSAPALGRRWWAERGDGAFDLEGRLQVSDVARLEEAQLSYNSIRDFYRQGMGEQAMTLVDRCARVRGFGDFWSHMLVAEGGVDVAVEPVVAPWDLAAIQVIVEEAGGRFSDLTGRRGYEGGSAISSNGLLHDVTVQIFGR